MTVDTLKGDKTLVWSVAALEYDDDSFGNKIAFWASYFFFFFFLFSGTAPSFLVTLLAMCSSGMERWEPFLKPSPATLLTCSRWPLIM